MLARNDIQALLLSFELAAISTLLLLLIGTPLAWWFARSQHRARTFLETLVALPLVLPPTVVGFYLLIAFSPQSALGEFLQAIGIGPLAFTFSGLVVGSIIYSLPFVVQPLQNAFASIDQQALDSASCLRASPFNRFISVVLPQAKNGFFCAGALGFAHTLGEFGIVLMVGGNIPGETQVASIAIYEHVESLQYGQAHALSLALMLIAFLLLSLVFSVNRKLILAR